MLLFLPFACGNRAPREELPPQDLSFLARDGARLAGTVYTPTAKGAAGLLLVHGEHGDRSDFDSFARRAQRSGYYAVAFDRRGYDDRVESGGIPSSASIGELLTDIDAARIALVETGADPDNVALIGAEDGAFLALEYAARDPKIPAVVLLSPEQSAGGDSTGDLLRAYGKRPFLLLVSTGDVHGLSVAESLRAAAAGHCEIHEYEGTSRGIGILDTVDTSAGQLLLWLEEIVGPDAIRRNEEFDARTGEPGK